MPEIIADTYEKLEYIGAGGGGRVFLARHLRLNKLVVLKADKRKITVRPELLRREVDVLKDLSHQYIPKVYDYFVDNDTVYTVMDYIEGESLDKPLKRGEKFPQAQVIEWAMMLLRALQYLHSPTHGIPPRGYVHGDIKPANIMLSPSNTICLIDFNIALALGEENVIGASAGYASPEHYGLDYSLGFTKIEKKTKEYHTSVQAENDKTELLNKNELTEDNDKTELLTVNNAYDPNAATELLKSSVVKTETGNFSTSSVKRVVPDVRSDIFSVGATLYHLLSGKRPASKFQEIVPLSDKDVSPPLAKIINKAMNINPDLRYQTAEDMLYDFEHLREHDPRVIKRRRGLKIFESCMGTLLAAGLFISFTGLKRMNVNEEALKLAEYSNSALQQGNSALAVDYAMRALPKKKNIFTPEPPAEIQCSLTGALKVYDLSDNFKTFKTVELPSEPLDLKLSPDGKTFVCICSGKAIVCDTESAEIIAELSADKSALSTACYIGNDSIAYASPGAIRAYNIRQKKELWNGEAATSICISADGSTAAALYKDNGYAVIYDIKTGTEINRVDFGGRVQSVKFNDSFVNPRNSLFALNSDGTLLAASFSDNTVSVFETNDSTSILDLDESDFYHFEGGFCGKYLAFAASGTDSSTFVSIDLDDGKAGSMSAQMRFSLSADENGVYLETNNMLVRIDPATGEQTPLITTPETVLKYAVGNGHSAVSTKSGVLFFDDNALQISHVDDPDSSYTFDFLDLAEDIAVIGSLNSNVVRIMKYECFPEAKVTDYDTSYEHDEARISADGQTVMLFRFDEFSIFDMNGNLIKIVEIPDADTVFDQQFIRKGGISELEVTYYSGKTAFYSASDGQLVREETREPPDKDIEDIFLTDKLKFVSPLHGTPKVYDIKTGKLIAELNEDAYLTYITQQGEYLIAQYIRTDGEFYGILMNEKCETLAKLPNLCDVYNGELYFDYPTGNLRRAPIYTLDDLINITQTYEKGDVIQ